MENESTYADIRLECCRECPNLEKVVIGSYVRELYPLSFSGCQELKTIIIDSEYDKLSLSETAFEDCTNVKTVNLSKYTLDKITTNVNKNGKNETYIKKLKNSYTINENGMFVWNISTTDNDKLSEKNFFGAVNGSMEIVLVKEKVEYDKNTKIIKFTNIDSNSDGLLNKDHIEQTHNVLDSYKNTNNESKIANNFNIKEIVIVGYKRIEENAFKDAIGNTDVEITIPDTLIYIGKSAFENCKFKENTLTFKSDLQYVGPRAFKNSENIKTINCSIPELTGNTMFKMATNIFEDVGIEKVNLITKQ